MKETKMLSKRTKEKVDREIEGVVLEVKDLDAWNRARAKAATTPYGPSFADFIERWGRLMQARMAKGARLQDIVHTTSIEADNVGNSDIL